MASGENKAFDRICGAEINGITTNFVFNRFRNKFFLLITQNQKMCNLFTVRFEAEQDQSSPLGEMPGVTPSLNIIHNFGKDTDEVRSAIQFIVSRSKLSKCKLEVMLNLGLNEINGKCLKEIVKILDTIL